MASGEPEWLSPLARELIEVLGYEDFLGLWRGFRGENLYVAQEAERSQIAAHVSAAGMARLIKRSGGTYIRVPLGRRARKPSSVAALRQRNARIRELWGSVPVRTLIRRFDLTEQRLFEIWRRGCEAR